MYEVWAFMLWSHLVCWAAAAAAAFQIGKFRISGFSLLLFIFSSLESFRTGKPQRKSLLMCRRSSLSFESRLRWLLSFAALFTSAWKCFPPHQDGRTEAELSKITETLLLCRKRKFMCTGLMTSRASASDAGKWKTSAWRYAPRVAPFTFFNTQGCNLQGEKGGWHFHVCEWSRCHTMKSMMSDV